MGSMGNLMRGSGSLRMSLAIRMAGLDQLDYTHAIFSGLTSIWRKLFIFLGVGLLAHFVGGNIYRTPELVVSLQTGGLAGLSDTRKFDIAWLPLEWLGTALMSLAHPVTMVFPFLLGAAFISAMRQDEFPFWVIAFLVVLQPLDTFLVSIFSDPLAGTDGVVAAVAMLGYLVLSVLGIWAWHNVRGQDE